MSNKTNNLLDTVYFLGRDWEFWQRKPHLEGLSKYSRFLCVEPPITVDTPFRKPKIFLQWLAGKRGLRQLSKSLWLYKPLAIFPYYISFRFPSLKYLNLIVMGISLRKALRKLKMKDIIIMISHPAQYYVIGMFDEILLCYDVYDAYAEAINIPRKMKKKIVTAEEEILKKADIVFTSALNLANDKKKLNPKTYFVPNTADVTFFMKSLSRDSHIPVDLAQTKRPRIGLIGHVSDNHTDIELLNYLAEKHPDWSIVVIGKIVLSKRLKRNDAFIKWGKMPNIYHLGFKNYEILPFYLKGIDVCILPYKINNYTVNVFPNKLFQYLAGGKPVVSTDLPEMTPYREVISIAKNYAEFERLIEEALKNDDPQMISRRIEVAQENSAEKRAKTKIEIIKKIMKLNR